MSGSVPRKTIVVLVLLARLSRALGFRWIMPIGTIPLPFHPVLARLLPWMISAWIAYGIVGLPRGWITPGWRTLLGTAAALAVPLSIPIVNWLAMAFRLPLLQGLLILGAAILAAVDAGQGEGRPWTILFPAVFAVLYLVQRIGGPASLRRIQAANAAFVPSVAGSRIVTVATAHDADRLFQKCDVARVHSCDGKLSTHRLRYRLSPADLAALAGRMGTIGATGWTLRDDGVSVERDDAPDLADAIRVEMVPHRSPLWLLAGDRSELRVDDGARVERLVGGQAAAVGRWPIFTAFYWLAIFGGRSQWVVGFARETPVILEPPRACDLLEHAFVPPGGNPAYADAVALHAALDALDREQSGHAGALLAALLDPTATRPPGWGPLLSRPDLFAHLGEELCARLASARDAQDDGAVLLTAELLSRLPGDEWRALSPVLLTLLRSKLLGFRVIDDTVPGIMDMPEREKLKHVTGGHRLIRRVPRLYERLGELGEDAGSLVMALGDAANWPDALVRAHDRPDPRSGNAEG